MPAKKHNGSSAEAELNLDHELPPAEENKASALQPDAEAGGKVVAAEDPATELERVRNERAAYLDRAARIQAEFENYRKRSEKQQQEFKEYALAGAMTTLLPILDSLDRALNTKAASLEDFHSGIELIDKQFHDALAKLGVQPVPAEGEPFDPNVHQAIQMVDTDEVEDNHCLLYTSDAADEED